MALIDTGLLGPDGKPLTEYPPLIHLPGKDVKPPYGFRPINRQQYDYVTSPAPNLFLYGNRGGGKSVTARWNCHALALSYPGYRYAILRTSFPELIKNHLIYVGEEMIHLGGSYNASKFIAHYPNGSIGFYMQAETDEQARNALGVEMMCVVFDEAPTFKWEHIMMIASSVRVPRDSGLVPLKRFNGNPIGPCIDTLWKYFIEKDVDPLEEPDYIADDWQAIKISMEDNSELDVVAYKKQLGVGLPEHIRKAWLEGEKTDYGQLFEVKRTIKITDEEGVERTIPYHVIDELPLYEGKPIIWFDYEAGEWKHPEWVRVFRAYDHGFWPDPAVCLWFAVIGKEIICFKEMVVYKTIVKKLAEMIVAESKGMKVVTTYCDPTLAKQDGADILTIKDTFEHNGVPMEKSVNNREFYAHALNSALKTEVGHNIPRFRMWSRGCPYLIKSLPQMRYDEDNPNAMDDHKHDHAPIAAAYFFLSHIPTTAPTEYLKRPKWMQPKTKKPRKGYWH